MSKLEPMPTEGPVSFVGGLGYLYKVLMAKMARASVISAFRREVMVEQRKLDEILRDLGKRAREVELQHDPIAEEMGNLRALEAQRAETESGSAALSGQLEEAEAKFASVEQDCNNRIAAAQEQISTTQTTLNEKNNELKAVRTRIAGHDKELGGLSGSLRSKTAAAAKAQDEAKQQALEQEAVDLSAKIAEIDELKQAAMAEATALEGPVTELTATLADGRTRLQGAQQELAAARQELAMAKRALGVQEQQKGQELTRLDREMAQKFLDIGRLLETNRVGVPGGFRGAAHPAFEELYGRIDDCQGGIRHREDQINTLEGERNTYDRRAFKNGLIIVLAAGGFLVLVIATLVILFGVVLD
jgi:chromosome segregation ATPase